MHSGSYLLLATPSVTFEMNASRQGQKRPDKGRQLRLKTLSQRSFNFGIANIISTLLIFNVLKNALEPDGRSWLRESAVYG